VLLPLIKKENDTFGDILLLDDIEDTNWTANHIKPFEFFKRVTEKAWKGRTYKFVSKVDQDSFIDPVRIWNKYLKGRMRDTGIKEDRLMLSMSHEAFCECPAPQGSFYTLSWDLAKLITRLYNGMEDRKDIEQEDCMVGKFPTQAGEQYEFVSMDEEESFDVIGEKGAAIAKDWSTNHAERGPLEKMEKVVFLHQMKEEWKWLAVKELFNEDGWARNGSSGETV
jgi:beta-1,3-galactosyltransferase 1